MKRILTIVTGSLAVLASTPVWAGEAPAPVISEGGDGSAALILLVMVGAVLLLNGSVGSMTHSKDVIDTDEEDDIIQKF